jgi:multisubunit Na+/H+ antiporter MnhG subunit
MSRGISCYQFNTRRTNFVTTNHDSYGFASIRVCLDDIVGAALLMASPTLKAIGRAIFAVLTRPVSTHAIAVAAYRQGVPMRQQLVQKVASVPAMDIAKAEEESYAA